MAFLHWTGFWRATRRKR